MTLLLLKLLMAHLIADFLIQPISWIKDKEQKAFVSKKLILHTLVHAVLYAMALSFSPEYWLGWLVLVISHYLIDGMKSISGRLIHDDRSTFFNRRSLFVMDQFLHVVIIIMVVGYYFPELYQMPVNVEQLWLLAITALLLTRVSSIVIKVLISRWTPLNLKQDKDNTEETSHSLANAGSYIGFLERLFIFVFIITNHWEGVGFLLAAKSVFRFGDLKEAHDRRLTEYILIGTLISFGLAIGISLAYEYFSAIIA